MSKVISRVEGNCWHSRKSDSGDAQAKSIKTTNSGNDRRPF